jgi:outer membrane lipoprotein-sorting protein
MALHLNLSFIIPQTLDEIIDLQFDAVKQDKFNKVQTLQLEYKIKSGKEEGSLIIFHKRNNLMRIEKNTVEQNLITLVKDKDVWQYDLNSKSIKEVKPYEKDQLTFKADLDGYFFCYKEKQHNLELVGKEKVNKKDFYRIKCSKPIGDESNIYLDAKTYLIDRIVQSQKDGELIIETKTQYSDYKLQNGIPFPNKIRTEWGNFSEELKLSRIEFDLAFPDSIFSKESLLK